MLKLASVAALLSLISACEAGPYDQEGQPIVGSKVDAGQGLLDAPFAVTTRGIVQITYPGSTRVRTGVLVADDLVLTSSRWVASDVVPDQVNMTSFTANTAPEQRTALAITINPYLPVAIIQMPTPLRNNHAPTVDARSAAALVGIEATCFALNSWTDYRQAFQTIRRTDGAREVIVSSTWSWSGYVEDADAGAPCFDETTGSWIGFVLSANDTTHEGRVFAASEINFFIQNMKRVARLRLDQGNGYLVQTTAPNGSPMCLDVPSGNPYNHAALNQFPCHGKGNQRWYLDHSHPSWPSYVNQQTGTCIDVPNGSTTSGQLLQMSMCHDGLNQGWAQSSGYHLWPLSAPSLCMSVRGGASANKMPIEQATCSSTAPHQRWITSN